MANSEANDKLGHYNHDTDELDAEGEVESAFEPSSLLARE